MITLTPFKAIDWYVEDPLEYIENPHDIATKLETRGVAISAYTEEGCIGCGGFIYWDVDNAEAWVRVSKKGFAYRKEGIRAIKKMFEMLTNLCTTNMYCWVDAEWLEAQRMVEWLGFTPTRVSKKINGKLYFIWDADHGNGDDDNRDCSIRDGCYATGPDGRRPRGSTSTNS